MLFNNKVKKKFDKLYGRYDELDNVKYFSLDSLDDLKYEEFNVQGANNIKLIGGFYFQDKIDPKKLVVFDHGFGPGVSEYIDEIRYLTKDGYTVYAYDHTGCGRTSGDGITSLSQGVNDLDHVLSSLNNDERFSNSRIFLVGHSWGGYNVMNVVKFHKEVSHVAVLAGFISVEEFINENTSKLCHKFANELIDREKQLNPKYAELNAIESLNSTDAHLLFIQSRDDDVVNFDKSFTVLYNELNTRPDAAFLPISWKGHYPQRSKLSNKERIKYFENKKSMSKEELLSSTNWDIFYQQDEIIWSSILSFFEF